MDMNASGDVTLRSSSRTWPRVYRVLGAVLGVAVIAVIAGGFWVRHELAASLPQRDGTRVLAGLSGPVRVFRDGLGIPAISGSTRRDVARATGFVHAQDRFFQMDLSRRRAAGELAELLGRAALGADKAARLHRFRARAEQVVADASSEERALLAGYAEGVNAGLLALDQKPFEYLVLRTAPMPWRPEDSVLVLASMFFNLQDSTAARESRVALTRDLLPPALAGFVLAPAGEWEAPLLGEVSPPVPVPGPEVVNLREKGTTPGPSTSGVDSDESARSDVVLAALGGPLRPASAEELGADLRGSNNWALSGAHTANGAALVADDMHLGTSVPNTWYRASLEWDAADGQHRVAGVTLPGVPNLVAGSNGTMAWGFTNTGGDWSDLVLIDPDPASADRYLTLSGPRLYVRRVERIKVRGGADELLPMQETMWGPVLDIDHKGRPRAICWVPAQPGGMNLHLFGLETARTIEELFAVANAAGIPAQNLVAGDRGGRIAWTIAGRIPRRVGFDGNIPTSWADGSRHWNGWLDPVEYPRIVDPPSGRLWTANNRVVDGGMLQAIGDGSFDLGARAQQIRDDLAHVEGATPADMLKIQLDDRALFLSRWRDLLLRTLTPTAIGSSAQRQEFRRLVQEGWTGRASVDSVGYNLVRAFRLQVADLALQPLLAPAIKANRRSATPARGWVPTIESPLWALVSGQPIHLLAPKYATWSALLLDAVDQASASLTAGGRKLADRRWGEENTVRIAHPLSGSIPFVKTRLDMPREALPGDSNMPRAQGTSFGASERFAVSPGHEDKAYLHMPGGQSGHPLSPHFGDGHRAWARGEPTPFLPGPAVNRLTLVPR
jgi:penicillin amidase